MLTVPAEELVEITGYRQPAAQLRYLHERGFWRAYRLPISGAVKLERAHYEAVCAGVDVAPAKTRRQPQLRSA